MLLTVALATAGCAAADGSRSAVATAERAGPGATVPRQPSGAQGGSSARTPGGTTAPGTALKAARTQVVRTATLTVRTADVPGALARARAAVADAGGYPADETSDRDPDGRHRSKLVLRVPPEHYDALLARLSGLGEVLSREVSAQDVTDQVVDVDSRVTSQRASVARIRALMDRASSISDIAALESQLSTREADLESLEAQQTSLKDRTGTATVTLLLRQPGAPSDPTPDDGTFQDALSDAWRAFTAAARWVLVALAAALPFAAAAAALYGLWRAVRGRLPARRSGGRHTAAPGADGAAGPGTGTGTGTGTDEPADAGPATAEPATREETADASAPDAPKAPGVSGEAGRSPR
ncbi:DUF4349 domain-containing protein [Streptomyces albulus]|uniref:DUF4349 domain-containing protein n=1 Tax=Streptomyces noursei TaxID=1971 RepID=UPI001F37AAB9|nr:DUF4349 domain-containing protein [Streptomyces noursei]MCE4944102.1 DUF4349 domain-containing protein [Streptomyces noursei]